MEKRLNNSHYIVFGLVLLVLVMGVISVVRAPPVANNYVWHGLSQIGNGNLDGDNNGQIDKAQWADRANAISVVGTNANGEEVLEPNLRLVLDRGKIKFVTADGRTFDMVLPDAVKSLNAYSEDNLNPIPVKAMIINDAQVELYSDGVQVFVERAETADRADVATRARAENFDQGLADLLVLALNNLDKSCNRAAECPSPLRCVDQDTFVEINGGSGRCRLNRAALMNA